MINNINPIFLLADSQLLFCKSGESLFYKKINYLINTKEGKRENITAAYIGASNNDNPEFYELFKEAMKQFDIRYCRMIKSIPDCADKKFLGKADIVLLAGGNTENGWDIIKRNNWNKIIIEKYNKGSILIGVSAGAIQIGMGECCIDLKNQEAEGKFGGMQLIPYIIDVHSNDDWNDLSNKVSRQDKQHIGIGIPSGAGMIVCPDMSLEAIRYSCIRVVKSGKNIVKSSILPYRYNL